MTKRYDVIIIGAGSVGNPTAYFLAESGFRVLVVDELASTGQGQNKSAIGGVRATHSDPAKIQICLQVSISFLVGWKKLVLILVGRKAVIVSLYLERKKKKILKSILPIQKRHGLKIDWIDSDGIKKSCSRYK
ncbi:FAD dependent oxidoreductase [Thermoplasmatales archaeon SCGC AB-539-C06]|nr:FAD dependent oxidoreductase [Thermoplasmatales archaeon SCGC AB-539-C06]